MADLRITLSIYLRLVAAQVRAEWEYRTSFVLFLLAQTILAGVDFAAIAVIFSTVDGLAGWSVAEVAFIYGLSGTAFGIAELFVSPVAHASQHIKAGSFDQFLIRPVGVLWHLLATEFATRRLARPLQPALVLAIAATAVDVDWAPADVLLVVLSLGSGMAIFGAIWVLTSTIAFWTVETQEIGNSVTYGGNTLTNYPVDVLGTWMRRFVTFVVPLASVAYLPAAWVFDKPTPGVPRAAAWLGPAIATGMVLVARLVWVHAVRHYRSTGS